MKKNKIETSNPIRANLRASLIGLIHSPYLSEQPKAVVPKRDYPTEAGLRLITHTNRPCSYLMNLVSVAAPIWSAAFGIRQLQRADTAHQRTSSKA